MDPGSSLQLDTLSPSAFERLVDILALQVLGAGTTSFGPGKDGGRDGLFEGTAPYPSETDQWTGTWHIQAKFHAPHLSKDPQKWLLNQIREELALYSAKDGRQWPTNWIVATNIDPSGAPETGCFDKAVALVRAHNRELASRFAIWGGSKIIGFLRASPAITDAYRHLITPGHVLSILLDQLNDERASAKELLEHLTHTEFRNNLSARLNEAGLAIESRPLLQNIFVDLPTHCALNDHFGLAIEDLRAASELNHASRPLQRNDRDWKAWGKHPRRASAWLIKGGPGQGKSTAIQHFLQLNRASILAARKPETSPDATTQNAIELIAKHASIARPRIPLHVELKSFAKWFAGRQDHERRGVLSFLAAQYSARLEKTVEAGLIRRIIESTPCIFAFDGLDEVPSNLRAALTAEVARLVSDLAGHDVFAVYTSRPQGYEGHFDTVQNCAHIELTSLPAEIAENCVRLLFSQLGTDERTAAEGLLRTSMESDSIRELMTTPLQAHIVGVLICSGVRPPDRKWELYNTFYRVMAARETAKSIAGGRFNELLRDNDALVRSIHNRLAFLLHCRSESAKGASATLPQAEFTNLVRATVRERYDTRAEELTNTIIEAASERLIFMSTPRDASEVGFDLRQLQEYFAAEYVRSLKDPNDFSTVLQLIAKDSHWDEVVYFTISGVAGTEDFAKSALAASALTQVDANGNTDAEQKLSRAIGMGLRMAMRLLGDGVLETDKRAREVFWSVLSSTLWHHSRRTMQTLFTLGPYPETRAWLSARILDAVPLLGEHSQASALLYLLHLGDDRAIRVAFETASAGARTEALDFALTSDLEPSSTLVALLSKHLVSNDCDLQPLRSNPDGKVGQLQRELFKAVLGPSAFGPFETAFGIVAQAPNETLPVGNGLFSTKRHRLNRAPALGAELQEIAKAQSGNISGLLHALSFLMGGTRQQLLSLRTWLAQGTNRDRFLPYVVSGPLRFFLGTAPSPVETMTDADFAAWADKRPSADTIEHARIRALTKEQLNDDLHMMANRDPALIVDLWKQNPTLFDSVDGDPSSAIAAARVSAEARARVVPSTWSRLRMHAEFAEVLSEINDDALGVRGLPEVYYFSMLMRMDPEPVDIRRLPGLVVPLARELVGGLEFQEMAGWTLRVEVRGREISMSELVALFVPNSDDLWLIGTGPYNLEVRKSALALWLVHPLSDRTRVVPDLEVGPTSSGSEQLDVCLWVAGILYDWSPNVGFLNLAAKILKKYEGHVAFDSLESGLDRWRARSIRVAAAQRLERRISFS